MSAQDHRDRISRRNIGDEAIAILRAGFFIGSVVWDSRTRNFDAMAWKTRAFADGFRTIEAAIQWIRENDK